MTRSIFLAVVIIVLFAWNSASASNSWSDRDEDELAKFAAMLKEAETMVRINSDSVQRAIVCRVGFQRFSVGAIARATGLTKTRLMIAVHELMNLGLVKVADVAGECVLLEPADEGASKNLRNWAYRFCDSDERCEIVH